jgi:hypothetical protein
MNHCLCQEKQAQTQPVFVPLATGSAGQCASRRVLLLYLVHP